MWVCYSLSHVPLLAIPWTVACQDLLSMEISRQEYWSELPFPSPGDLPDPGIKPASPALAAGFFTTSTSWEALHISHHMVNVLRNIPIWNTLSPEPEATGVLPSLGWKVKDAIVHSWLTGAVQQTPAHWTLKTFLNTLGPWIFTAFSPTYWSTSVFQKPPAHLPLYSFGLLTTASIKWTSVMVWEKSRWPRSFQIKLWQKAGTLTALGPSYK